MTNPSWSDFVPNSTFYRIFSGFHKTFATGDAHSSGHLVPSLWDLLMFYLLRPILFQTCYFSGLCSSNIPRYFLNFPLNLEDQHLVHSTSRIGCFVVLLKILPNICKQLCKKNGYRLGRELRWTGNESMFKGIFVYLWDLINTMYMANRVRRFFFWI